MAEEKAGKIGEILDFSRDLERRESLDLYKLTVARTSPRDIGLMNRQRKGGQAQSMENTVEKREVGVGRSKTDAVLKGRALKHFPINGQFPGTSFITG